MDTLLLLPSNISYSCSLPRLMFNALVHPRVNLHHPKCMTILNDRLNRAQKISANIFGPYFYSPKFQIATSKSSQASQNKSNLYLLLCCDLVEFVFPGAGASS